MGKRSPTPNRRRQFHPSKLGSMGDTLSGEEERQMMTDWKKGTRHSQRRNTLGQDRLRRITTAAARRCSQLQLGDVSQLATMPPRKYRRFSLITVRSSADEGPAAEGTMTLAIQEIVQKQSRQKVRAGL